MTCLKVNILLLLVGIGMIAQSGNAGDIEFLPIQNISTRAYDVQSVFTADVDSDGDMDVLRASRNGGIVSWYENNGSQSFTERNIMSFGGRYNAVTVSATDIDGDGDTDVIFSYAIHPSRKINLFVNDGNQNFSLKVISGDANHVRSVVVADVNNDGRLDMLSASSWDNKTAWYEQPANGVFGTWTKRVIAVAPGSGSVIVSDVDGDGDIDAFTTTNNGIQFYKNNLMESGSVSWSDFTISNYTARGVIATDINEDSKVDILAWSAVNKIVWYQYTGTPETGAWKETIIDPNADARGYSSIDAKDMDGDGHVDVVAVNLNESKIEWYKNDGNGNFTQQDDVSNAPRNVLISVSIGDIDGDGDNDVISGSLGDGRITWSENVPVTPPNTPPVISIHSNLSVPYNETLSVNFSVSDDTTPAEDIDVKVKTPLPALVNVSVSGTGSTRTLLIEPIVANAGTTSVRMTAIDRVTGDISYIDVNVELTTPANSPPIADAGTYPIQEANTEGGAYVTLDGSGSSDPDGDSLTYTWSIPNGVATGVDPKVLIPLGIHGITVIVSDDEITAKDKSLVSVVDTIPPAITAPDDITIEATGSLTEVVIGAANASDVAGTVTITSDAPSSYPLGITVVTWTADDGNGNSATDEQIITVVDTTPPAITAPDDISIEATGTLTEVAIGTANASDLAGTVTLTNDAPSSYPLGISVITWTANDGNGNLATDAQIITVVDTTPPTIDSISVDNSTLWPPNNKMVPVSVSLSATDSVNPNVTCQIIGITVTDEGGNTDGDAEFAPGTLSANLRAERSGSGIGRVYTIEVECSDGTNSTNAFIDVVVPHDQGNGKNGNGKGKK